jgi:hypothetical protein
MISGKSSQGHHWSSLSWRVLEWFELFGGGHFLPDHMNWDYFDFWTFRSVIWSPTNNWSYLVSDHLFRSILWTFISFYLIVYSDLFIQLPAPLLSSCLIFPEHKMLRFYRISEAAVACSCGAGPRRMNGGRSGTCGRTTKGSSTTTIITGPHSISTAAPCSTWGCRWGYASLAGNTGTASHWPCSPACKGG